MRCLSLFFTLHCPVSPESWYMMRRFALLWFALLRQRACTCDYGLPCFCSVVTYSTLFRSGLFCLASPQSWHMYLCFALRYFDLVFILLESWHMLGYFSLELLCFMLFVFVSFSLVCFVWTALRCLAWFCIALVCSTRWRGIRHMSRCLGRWENRAKIKRKQT